MGSGPQEKPQAKAGELIAAPNDPLVDKALKRVNWVVPPLVLAANVMMALDRGTLSFAATQMNADLGFDATTFGLAAGIFYITYGICQVPSAAAGLRLGMRWWFGSIIIAWGVVAACTSLVQNAGQLYVMRLLLGAAEAGAAPCSYQLLSTFYPYERSAKPYAAMFVGGQVSGVISAPVAAALLSLNGLHGWEGWRWLFLIEGLPSIAVGLAVWALLPGAPLQAWWLPPEQREALHAAVHGEEGADAARAPPTLRDVARYCGDALSRPLLWVFMAAAFLWVIAAFSLHAWLPIIISNLLNGTVLTSATSVGGGRATSVKATLLSTVPYFFAAISLMAVAWSSDRTGEKTAHVAIPVVLSGAVLSCFGAVARRSAVGGFVILTASLGLAFAGQSTLVARAAGITPPAQAGITLGILNAVCSALGGFTGPLVVGGIIRALHSFEIVAIVMGALLMAAGLIVLGVYVKERLDARRAARGGGGGAAGAAEKGEAPPAKAGASLSAAAGAALAAPRAQ
ncbi:MAG: major facilitator superfamily domain-containing protein [Monoraphidium minutum]|nr:MAG: major facilitator superfamily domain-containing protein [Monoraphidium minutum]